MTKRDLMRLLVDVDDDQQIEIDIGGCSSWHYRIGCVAMASINGEAPVVLLAEDDDGEEYADRKGLETRRRFTDFEILWVQWIDRSGNDKNGTIEVLTRAEIDQPAAGARPLNLPARLACPATTKAGLVDSFVTLQGCDA